MILLIQGLLFGLTLQMSVGPVCLGVMHKSITRGFREASKMVWGVVLADGAYIAASLLGMAKLLEIPGIKTIMLMVGAGVLIYFGLNIIMKNGNKNTCITAAEENENSFYYGLKLTLTNPLTIIFWSGVFGALAASGELGGLGSIMLYGGGCLLSTFLFLTIVSLGGRLLTPLLTNGAIRKRMDWVVGLFLIFFGLKMVLI